jgi:hypothetical protein
MAPQQSSTAAEVFPLTEFACRDGRESLVFGERADGTMAHVSEVSSGLECNCVCPGCGTRLVARKGDKNGTTTELPSFPTRKAADYVTLSETDLEKLRVDGGGPEFVRTGKAIRVACLWERSDPVSTYDAEAGLSRPNHPRRALRERDAHRVDSRHRPLIGGPG